MSELRFLTRRNFVFLLGKVIADHFIIFIPLAVIQQQRGPNFTQFWPPTPSSEQLWTSYIVNILWSRGQAWTFY